MGLFRAVGTLVAAGAGAGAGAGAALAVGDPFAVGAAAATVSLVVGYAVGHRGWVTFAAALSYLGVGTAVLAGASGAGPSMLADLTDLSMIPLQVGGALVGVGGAVALLFLLRWSTGNLKRLSTRPVDAGVVRDAVASVASTLRSGRSLVRRLAGARLGPLPVGAAVSLGLWGGVVGGSAALGALLSQGVLGVDEAVSLPVATDRSAAAVLAPVTLVPYLAGLLVPAYVATDWFALDGIEDAPETYGVLARAAGRTPPSAGRRTTTGGGASASGTGDTTSSADTSGTDAPSGGPAPGPPSTPEDTPDTTPAAAQESSGGPSASRASDRSAMSPDARIADTDGGARPGAIADVLDPKDGDADHWPNAEDNPWVDERSSGDAAGDTRETPDDEESPGDEETPALAPDDDTDDATADTDEGTLSDDDRVTFGEPSAGDAPDAGADDATEHDTETESDTGSTAAATSTDPAASESADSSPEEGSADSSPEEGSADEMDDEDDTEPLNSDPSTWATPPAVDETEDAVDSPDETTADTDGPDETAPTEPAAAASDAEATDDAGDVDGVSEAPVADDAGVVDGPGGAEDTPDDGTDESTDDGLTTEVLDVDLPDIESARERSSGVPDTASGTETDEDDAGTEEDADEGLTVGSDADTEADADEGLTVGSDADTKADADEGLTVGSDADTEADADEGLTVGGDAETDEGDDTPTTESSDDDGGDGTAGEVADRVSRILDGDLDAREVDATDVDVDANPDIDAESFLDAGGSEDTDATAEAESEESD